MDLRALRLACMLLAAAAAGEARGQSVAFDLPVPVTAMPAPAQVALSPWTAPPAFDLLLVLPRLTGPGSEGHLYRRGDLAELPFPWPPPLPWATCFTAGSWVGSSGLGAPGDGLSDLGWCHSSALGYQFSPDLPLDLKALYPGDPVPTGLAFARLLDRADLALAIAERQRIEIAPDPRDLDFTSNHFYRYPYSSTANPADTFALQPLRLGDVARTQGLHDLAWSRVGQPDLFVLWTLVASASADSANWDGAFLTFPGAGEVRGVGAADVDGDGIPDLLAVVVSLTGTPRLMALHNPGTPLSIDPASGVDAGPALGIASPSFAAPLDLDGVPAAAVFDEADRRLHVVTADPGGGLRSWSAVAPAAWGEPTQIVAGDLLGSPAADMVAVFVEESTQVATIQVWPGDLPPSIAWAPGSPPSPAGAGTPLDVAADASDADGPLASVELWLQGQPSGIVPAQSGSRYTFTVPTATLCTLTSPARFAVRATDDLGAWREVADDVVITDALSLSLPGDGTTQPVPLLPGGTTVILTAQVADGCGRPVSVDWSEAGLPTGAGSSSVISNGVSVYTLVVPEASYPAMVAGGGMTMLVTATATVSGAPFPPPAQLILAFDARGLVAADHVTDRTSLAVGDLALLTTTLRSRIGVALFQVALDDRLSGLVAAGPARVRGANAVASSGGPDGLTLLLDQVPGGGAPVVVELPVRLAVASGGSSRVQALAAPSGVPLSPSTEASAPGATPAGVACGSGGGSPLFALGLLFYMKAMRRVPARTRSTSSRTPMSRQA
ncbi:MAG TPA: VCBS repeat-containing protein [Anaeromyxobacteraceae bacterium]|nr:VCBS repeat-containing protein [Anaeromyxobacteraceae bacterium]